MNQLYYILNELIKSYHIFVKLDAVKAKAILERINKYRLQIVTLAAQRQIFIEQLTVVQNTSGYKNDVFFTHDDIDSLVSKFIAYLDVDVTISLVQQGTRENLFTRQAIAWQQLMSSGQLATDGQQIPFDLPQEIFLRKSETLDIGVINQTSADGAVFVHGCNLIDSRENINEIIAEINIVEFNGLPNLPKPVIVPIQYQFDSNVADTEAVAVDGGNAIYSVKSERSVVLTEVCSSTLLNRLTLIDKGRDMLICKDVEVSGFAGEITNEFAGYFPLPYPHLLRAKDRLQLQGLNGSDFSGDTVDADRVQTLAFRGFSI